MARFRCRACGDEGEFVYDSSTHRCPTCGAPDVQFAVGIGEIGDHALIAAMKRLAAMDDDEMDED